MTDLARAGIRLAAICGSIWFGIASIEAQAQGTAVSVQQKINVAGRQRMLSQRMSASVCLALARIETQARRDIAVTAHQDFDRALRGLVEGDEGLGLTPEADPEILSALEDVHDVWAQVGPAARQLAAGDLQSFVTLQLLEGNLPLLQASNTAVASFVTHYGEGDVENALAHTINIAGRQRMLSQKMMKHGCLLAVGYDEDGSLELLRASMALFDASLNDLRHGNAAADVLPPPNKAVAAQLDVVAWQWESYRTGLSQLQFGGPDNRVTMQALAAQSDAVLRDMHKAVQLYVAAAQD